MKKPQRLWTVNFMDTGHIVELFGYPYIYRDRMDAERATRDFGDGFEVLEYRLVTVKPKRKPAKRGRSKK